MNARALAVLMLAPLAITCAASDSPSESDTTWVGTITTEGNVTTVVPPGNDQ